MPGGIRTCDQQIRDAPKTAFRPTVSMPNVAAYRAAPVLARLEGDHAATAVGLYASCQERKKLVRSWSTWVMRHPAGM